MIKLPCDNHKTTHNNYTPTPAVTIIAIFSNWPFDYIQTVQVRSVHVESKWKVTIKHLDGDGWVRLG